MKKFVIILVLASTALHSSAQIQEAQQLILNLQKLADMRKILDNMYTGYKILTKGYNTIRDISQGNYSLHQAFVDGLMAVNPTVRNYKRIPQIIEYQKLLVAEYKRARNRFREDPGFTADELDYLLSVYGFVLDASIRNIDELMLIITATKLRMSDDERMQNIDRIFYDMESKLMFMQSFNTSTTLLAMQRARERQDVTTLRKLYGIR